MSRGWLLDALASSLLERLTELRSSLESRDCKKLKKLPTICALSTWPRLVVMLIEWRVQSGDTCKSVRHVDTLSQITLSVRRAGNMGALRRAKSIFSPSLAVMTSRLGRRATCMRLEMVREVEGTSSVLRRLQDVIMSLSMGVVREVKITLSSSEVSIPIVKDVICCMELNANNRDWSAMVGRWDKSRDISVIEGPRKIRICFKWSLDHQFNRRRLGRIDSRGFDISSA